LTPADSEVRELVAVLEATLSPNTEDVAQAQKLLEQAAESKLVSCGTEPASASKSNTYGFK